MSYINLEPGDLGFTNHAYVLTKKIKAGVSIEKGHVYGSDDDGYIIKLIASAGIVTVNHGQFQALAKSDAIAAEADGSRTAQFAINRSRIIMKCDADLVSGDQVELKAAAAVVTSDRVQATTATGSRLGVIYRFLDSSTIKAAANDLAYVDVWY